PEPQAGERQTDVILLTHCCLEAAVDAAVVRIESLPTVLSTAIRLRLEDLD
ncbi:MAG: homoserine dehydrogenase, partial [Betaproteobacteria bacterium]|nr:homoserine dehydrogenase [Betaproteobacteria bacterium]